MQLLDARRLCILDGVSPSLPIDRLRIAGALFMVPVLPTYAVYGLTSMKLNVHRWAYRHRVERSSPGTCSKDRRASWQCHAHPLSEAYA